MKSAVAAAILLACALQLYAQDKQQRHSASGLHYSNELPLLPPKLLSSKYSKNLHQIWTTDCDLTSRTEIKRYNESQQIDFMTTTFADTSILWSYQMINAPEVRTEIWKLATAFMEGGCYIECSALGDTVPHLSSIVESNDTLVVVEGNSGDVSDCYASTYHLSDDYAFQHYSFSVNSPHIDTIDKISGKPQIFHGNMISPKFLYAQPRNSILLQILQAYVEIVKSEYFHHSVVHMAKWDHRKKHNLCASSYLPTFVLREYFLRNSSQQHDADYKHDGVIKYEKSPTILSTYTLDSSHQERNTALLKLKYSAHKIGERDKLTTSHSSAFSSATGHIGPSSSSHHSINHATQYLRGYAQFSMTTVMDQLEGQVVTDEAARELFLITNHTRIKLEKFDNMVEMKKSMSHVRHLKDTMLQAIPLAEAENITLNNVAHSLSHSNSNSQSTMMQLVSTRRALAEAAEIGQALPPPQYSPPTPNHAMSLKIASMRDQINNISYSCYGDDYTGTRDDYIAGVWKNVIQDQVVMVYPMCTRTFQLGNTLGYYLNDLACADVVGAHFIAVHKHYDFIELGSLQTQGAATHAFLNALPDLVINSHAAPSRETAVARMKSDCQCLQYCWENNQAPWIKRVAYIKTVLTTAIAAYVAVAGGGGTAALTTTLSNITDFALLPMSTASASSSDVTAFVQGARVTELQLPLIPDVTIQYRCGDNIGFGKTRYGLLPFPAITRRIPALASMIFIIADSPTRSVNHAFSGRCHTILEHLAKFIHQQFPQSTVVVKRGGDQFLDYARLARSNVTICSASTFCLWPALSNQHNVYFPLTPLVARATSNITAPYFNEHFHWITEVEIIKEFKQFRPWTRLMDVLEGKT